MIERPNNAATSSAMSRFFRKRGYNLAVVIFVSFIISLSHGVISYSVLLGALQDRFNVNDRLLASLHWLIRGGLLILAGTLWTLKRRRALVRVITIANAFSTAALIIDVAYLLSMLSGSKPAAATALVTDAALIAVSNFLIFSIWYWIIDPPGVIEGKGANRPWAFLFPQRSMNLPHYESWRPRYADYLFVAFTASAAFSPADALPLTRTAKMLMMAQAAVSLVTVTGIAGGAIGILAGGD